MNDELSTPRDFVPTINIKASEAIKKPRLEAILFCDYVTRTNDGKLILAGSFDRVVFGHDEEKVTMSFFLFVRTAETTKGRLQIAIINPNEEVILAFGFDTELHPFDPKWPAQVNFIQQLQFPALVEGLYWFDVSYLGEPLGGAALIIEHQKQEEVKDENDKKASNK